MLLLIIIQIILKKIYIIISFFCLFYLLYIYTYIIFLNFSNIIIDFPLDTFKRKVYRIFLTFLLILMFISILIWRIIRRNRYISIDKEYVYSLFLDILENYELTYISLLFLILLGILLILLWIGIFGTIMLYIKGIGYTAHVYFYQFESYKKVFRKLLYSTGHIERVIFENIEKVKHMKPLYIFLNYVHNNLKFIFKLSFIFITLLPFLFLFYDIYMYSCISRFFYCLPWVYLLILIRMFFKLIDITYGPTEDKAASLRSSFLYRHKRHYLIYKLNCKTLEVTNK